MTVAVLIDQELSSSQAKKKQGIKPEGEQSKEGQAEKEQEKKVDRISAEVGAKATQEKEEKFTRLNQVRIVDDTY